MAAIHQSLLIDAARDGVNGRRRRARPGDHNAFSEPTRSPFRVAVMASLMR